MSPAARRTRLTSAATSAAIGALVLVGCSSTVTGTAEPSTGSATSSARSGVDLSTLLIDPSSFPAPYDALVLPQQAISQAAPDLSGIPAGAEVSPAGCKPADQDFGPTGTAMIVGTDNDSRSTISIELTAVDEPLSARKEQLEQCGEVTATKSGATSTVTSTLTPAPPIDADDTLAVRQTVASGAGGDAVTQSMLTLMAQIDGVRVSATFMSFGSGTPDATTLDELFTAAVQKVGQS
ncbi:hypothetical protein CH274_07735 [Rhodococcus sp. 06-418-5]|uniref:DUF5642 family protein n=1 Tax=Rhodococcus sp. 06-418-5 TaxID=2022507 RepID=UPI000B9B08E4|nr:DUF5642 family protein [Rhodococcus sp. 06-418-5]OZC82869.1 hypothetical protein CH274_07735 [Rhodococcus sp. 06-418-5]